MALVEWSDTYVVNVREVDNQHKRLVTLVNELHDAVQTGKAKEVMGKVLGDLVNYTVYHFATEERFFDIYNYPDSESHKKQHTDLIEQITTLQKKYESGEKSITIDVMNYLHDWLHNHIVGSDKLFGPFLNSKGIS